MRPLILMAALALAAPLAPAIAAPAATSSLKQLHAEMATARHELTTGDLRLGGNQRIHTGGKRHAAAADEPPEAVITPTGQLKIAGKLIATTPHQHALLTHYREQVVSVGLAGIDVGERAAGLALEAVDVPVLSLLASAFTGGLERKLESRLKDEMAPLVLQLCEQLPAVLSAQDSLAAQVVEFRPYANLKPDDILNCRQETQASLGTS